MNDLINADEENFYVICIKCGVIKKCDIDHCTLLKMELSTQWLCPTCYEEYFLKDNFMDKAYLNINRKKLC